MHKFKRLLFACGLVAFHTLGAEEIIKDNDNTTVVVSSPTDWVSSTASAGFIGSDYLHDQNIAGTVKTVRYPFSVSEPDSFYRVYGRWTSHPNRSTQTKYFITHSGGSTEVSVNQQENGGTWISLGDYQNPSEVVISNEGADGYVVADAVRVEKIQSPSLPSGEAYIPTWRTGESFQENSTVSRAASTEIRISNISGEQVRVSVALRDEDGTLISDNGDAASGVVKTLGPVVSGTYSESGEISFELESQKSVRILIDNGPSVSPIDFGFGKISWESTGSNTLDRALLAHVGEYYGYSSQLGVLSHMRSIAVNNGAPF